MLQRSGVDKPIIQIQNLAHKVLLGLQCLRCKKGHSMGHRSDNPSTYKNQVTWRAVLISWDIVEVSYVSCQCHASWHWSMDVHGDPILVLTRNSGLLWRLWQREFAETLFEREPWLHSSEQMWAVISALARTSRKRDNSCTEVTSISCHKWYDSMRTILCLVVFVAQMKMQRHASARSAPGSCRIFSTAGKAVSSRPGWVMLCLSYAACDFLRIGHIRMKCMDIPGNHDGGWSIFASLLDPCWPLLVLQDPETTIHVVAGTITFLPLGLAVFAASTCALTAQSSSA